MTVTIDDPKILSQFPRNAVFEVHANGFVDVYLWGALIKCFSLLDLSRSYCDEKSSNTLRAWTQ
jgi:hypothetical protein